MSDEQPAATEPEVATNSVPGVTINIEFPGRTLVSVEGAVDAAIVRAVMQSLRGMIPANTQIWLVAGVTDLRRGYTSLSGLVQSALDKSPFSGHVFKCPLDCTRYG